MAGTYKGRSVPNCFINEKGKMLAMWESDHPQCERCSVEAYCKEAQDRLIDGEFTEDVHYPEDDFGFSDEVPPTYTSLPPGVRRVTPPAKRTMTPTQGRPQPLSPRGPRVNELQLAVPRTRQALPYEGETLMERLGKNVVLGTVTSAAFETMLTFGSYEWKPALAPTPVPAPDQVEPEDAFQSLEEIKRLVEIGLKKRKNDV